MAAFTVIYHDEVDASPDAYWERTGIPTTYDHLLLRAQTQSDNTSTQTELRMQLNSSTTYAEYTATHLQANGTTVQGGQQTTGSGTPSFSIGYATDTGATPADSFGTLEIWFPNYTTTTNWTVGIATGMREAGLSIKMSALLFSQQAALTAIKITPLSGSFDQYSTFTLIGVSCDA